MVIFKALVTVFLFIIIIVLVASFTKVFALSPSFIRQEVFDGINDTLFYSKEGVTIGKILPYDESIDIAGVSYFSDGKILNATLAFATDQMNGKDKDYRMLIDVDSNNKTGSTNLGGADYILQIFRGNFWDHPCSASLMEWTLSKDFYFEQNPPNGFFTEIGSPLILECNFSYIRFFLNLSQIAYPKEFNIAFFSHLSNNTTNAYDFTKWIHIPPPNLAITSLENNIELRQDEQKNIHIAINSTTDLESIIQLSSNYKGHYANVSFIEDTIRISPFGSEIVSIPVNISKNSTVGSYITIPIIADISFPYRSIISSDENSTHILKENPFLNTSSYTNILVKVKGPLTFSEFLSDINNTWIAPIAGIWTFLIGVLTASITFIITINKIYKKKKSIRRSIITSIIFNKISKSHNLLLTI